MKKIAMLFMLLSFGSTPSYAEFWSNVASGVTANSITNSGSRAAVHVHAVKQRADKVAKHLWAMHEKGIYDEDYKFYLDYLEDYLDKLGYDNIHHLDTVAWVYRDNGNKSKAIAIYKNRILPWVKIENEKKRYMFKGYFLEISK